MPHEENRRRLPKEHQRSRPTTIATLPWGPLEHQEGLFHPLCLAASKALHMKRSSLYNKLGVQPSGTRIPSHPGKETNTTATRYHAEEGERQWSSWLERSTSKEHETLLELMKRRCPSWKSIDSSLPLSLRIQHYHKERDTHIFWLKKGSHRSCRVPSRIQQWWSRKRLSSVRMVKDGTNSHNEHS